MDGDVRDSERRAQGARRGRRRVTTSRRVVGVGQSMYEIARYTAVNNLGTAVLLEALIEEAGASGWSSPPA